MTNDHEDIPFLISSGLRTVPKGIIRRMISEHTPDTPYAITATYVLKHLQMSGYDVVRVKPPAPHHSYPKATHEKPQQADE